ncbi:auxin-responsive protein SAUR62-like [Amaranthus tricolor]|uniref:auxin-responsive protein SAUR62-like n=1 Tax=Amaranthus tricolor TaxID=29722 RepID=UPI0025852B4C|nr:auxin-responsive protein SAUR62-like [Amaranthus tricolor]
MARKRQKLATTIRRRISWSRTVTKKVILWYTQVIKDELFKMAEEEFGVVASGPIVLPCDSSFMEYAISIIQRHVAEGLEKTFDYVLDYLQMLWFLNLKQPCE